MITLTFTDHLEQTAGETLTRDEWIAIAKDALAMAGASDPTIESLSAALDAEVIG